MQNKNSMVTSADFNSLVRELLGLDPVALSSMDTTRRTVGAGLHEFMRRTLEWALASLCEEKGAKFQLCADASARALSLAGWPDVQTYNLSMLFAHALVTAPRRARGNPYLPLCPPQSGVVELVQKQRAGQQTPTAALVAVAVTLLEVDFSKLGAGAEQPVSICKLIRKMLKCSPKDLVRRCYEANEQADAAFRRNPEGQACAALAAHVMMSLRVYQNIAAQEVGRVSFLIAEKRAPYARLSNITHLLAAALVDDTQNVSFIQMAS